MSRSYGLRTHISGELGSTPIGKYGFVKMPNGKPSYAKFRRIVGGVSIIDFLVLEWGLIAGRKEWYLSSYTINTKNKLVDNGYLVTLDNASAKYMIGLSGINTSNLNKGEEINSKSLSELGITE